MAMGFFRTFFPWGWTCLVHFLVVEMRALYLFYGSVKSFTAKIAISAEMERQLGDDSGTTDWQKICLHDQDMQNILECVEEGVQGALWTLWIDDSTRKGCYRADEPGLSYVGLLNISALVACGLFLLMCLFLLFASDVTDWRAGNYLHFTWELEHRKTYRFGATVLLTYTAGFVAYVIMASCELLPAQHLFLKPEKLLTLAGMDMFGILSSSYAFLDTPDPPFNWQESALLTCKFFGRPWYNIVSGANDSFGNKLEHAILKARLKEPKELEDLMGYEYVGPLTQCLHSGGCHLSDADQRLFLALGAVDERTREMPVVMDPEPGKSSGWCCGASAPARSTAVRPTTFQQEQQALLMRA